MKDLKNGDIFASLFTSKYNAALDITLSKTDHVFDSFTLSDFHLIGAPDLLHTAQLHAIINGLTLLPLTFLYARLTNEFGSMTIVNLLKDPLGNFFA